ncbi:MAG: helix-turn-helix domain-containing GNAT family N-acetyltransferase [Pyrinomonadaceae bacterium]|nr:helix-turn-helix domain-containing GNAT family N-acetyltransferase [Pyrinomonadaceae bacterium]
MEKKGLGKKVAKVRRFNHFYTKQINFLDKGLQKSPFSLAEARIINEIAKRETATASELGEELGLDTGYLSRVLQGFERRGLIEKTDSPTDARQRLLRLTGDGQKEFVNLNQVSHNQIEQILQDLTTIEQNRLINAMLTIESLLSEKTQDENHFLLRLPQAGDFGWVVQANSSLLAQENGWNEQYEALVAQTVADYLNNFNPQKDCCWIAEKNGENVGAVFLVKKSETIAQLRLLFVEPKSRGLGIGKRLVHECTRFAKKVGFKKITLWTSDTFTTARSLFEKEGYKLIKTEKNNNFGKDLIIETWDLRL